MFRDETRRWLQNAQTPRILGISDPILKLDCTIATTVIVATNKYNSQEALGNSRLSTVANMHGAGSASFEATEKRGHCCTVIHRKLTLIIELKV
jgi:hypothetical protein